MQHVESAFHWITNLLEEQRVPYSIFGGFAAHLHGVNRPIADLDLLVAPEHIEQITPHVQPFITYGPARYRDECWDLDLLTLQWEGQEIDLASNQLLCCHRSTGQWHSLSDHAHLTVQMTVFGKSVHVESVESLISLKNALARDVDQEDVRQLTRLYHLL